MKLAVFGCSWSYGTSQHIDINQSQPNWVRSLAKLRPDISITNFAFKGSSIQFSSFLFNKYAKEYDYTIFQITSPFRFTLWPDQFNFKRHLVKYEDNLWQFDNKISQQVLNLNPSQLNREPSWKLFDNSTRHALNFSKHYYKYIDSNYQWFEYIMFLEHITKKADLRFFHRTGGESEWPQRKEISWGIEELITAEQYQSYLLDDGDHFNQEGCEWQANYINDKYLK
jgi:hypothetical protein